MALFGLDLTRRRTPKKGKADPITSPDIKARLVQLRTLLRRRWQLTFVLGAVVIAALYWFGLRPANVELEKWRSESAVAERRAEGLRAEYMSLQSAEGAAAASERFTRALELDDLLPLDVTPLVMLQTITSIAADAGLELGASTPAESPDAGPAEGLRFYSFAIAVEGEFPQVVSFVEGLVKARPLVSVHAAKFSYESGNLEAGVAASVRFEAELRFWSSNLDKLGDIKDQLEAQRREDQGLPPLEPEASPTTLLPPPTLPAGVPVDPSPVTTLAPVEPSPTDTTPVSTTSPSTSLPATTSPTIPPSVGEVSAGAFCDPEGSTGSVSGVPYVCSKTAKNGSAFLDGRAHWRPA